MTSNPSAENSKLISRQERMAWITILGTIVMILLAYVVMKYLDAPIRKFLKNKVTSPSA